MDRLAWLKQEIGTVNLGKYNDWKPPLERIRNIVPTAAATIVHVVVEQGAGEARKAQ